MMAKCPYSDVAEVQRELKETASGELRAILKGHANHVKWMMWIALVNGAGMLGMFIFSIFIFSTLNYNQALMEKMQPKQLEKYIETEFKKRGCTAKKGCNK